MKQACSYNHLVCFYNRSRKKLQYLISEGKNFRKQGILKKRIARLIKTISGFQHAIRAGIATAALTAGILLFQPNAAQAQIVFGPLIINPFGLIDIGSYITPTFVDLDNDGDLDMMTGDSGGNFQYFQNIGTAESPAFDVPTTNPFGLTDIGYQSAPAFADLDNDGDMDMMAGESGGNFKYFQNIGTAESPAFDVALTNPFDLTDIGADSAPTFADLDNDGDMDMLAGESFGSFKYFQNIGTVDAPAFDVVITNPFGLTDIDTQPTPTSVDLDNDGDLDMMAGFSYYGYSPNFQYFENIGSVTSPLFTEGILDPFGITSFGGWYTSSYPAFADLDNDGDIDLMAGESYGSFYFFPNFSACTLLPQPFYADLDNDEYGAGISLGISTCDSITLHFSFNNLDCNDASDIINPGSIDICNGMDDNCDGTVDEGIADCNPGPAIEWQNTIGGSSTDELLSIQQTDDGGYILGGSSYSDISGDKTESNTGPTYTNDYWVVKLDSSGAIEWQNTIGGSSIDILLSIQQTTDGGYILGGYSNSSISGDKTETHFGSAYPYDYWVVKLDPFGEIEWQNTIGGSKNDYLSDIQQTTDGGYILGGYSESGISGNKTEANWDLTYPYSSDYWIVKLDSIGSIEWQNSIGGSSTDNLLSIQQTVDGGYILGGYSYSGISGDKTEASLGGYDYWVIKLDSSGIIEWQNTIGEVRRIIYMQFNKPPMTDIYLEGTLLPVFQVIRPKPTGI